MGEVILKLLNMSLTASWLILAVICFRFIFRKVPKWVICLLWGLAAVKLICPFSIESTFSLLPNTGVIKDYSVVEGEVQNYIPSIDSNLHIVKNTINPMLAESFAYEEYESVAPLQVATFVSGIVWVCGIILLMLYAVISLLRLHLLVREAVPYRDNIMICDAVKSPFILGNIRPRIYLPSGLDENETEYIVAHEKAHLKRHDHWWKSLGYILLCVYWFNPLCWVAYILFCKDVELACDERVIRNMDIQDKKEYSRTLLSCANQRKLVLACPLAFGEVGVKERVKSVLHYKKPTFWLLLVSVVACLVIAVCFLTVSPKKYQIRVTIPAGGMESFYYSDEEISPKGKRLTLYAGEGLGDTQVVLLPVEYREENAYEPTYMTPGMPVKMAVEKGAWFKIGVSVQNPTEEDIDVYVQVENVDVRIASTIPEEQADETSDTPIGLVKEEINIEKYDVTHDGIPDEIITSLEYDPEFVDADATQQERIAQQLRGGFIRVEVFEGKENPKDADRENAIWRGEYSDAHAGNGQLSIVSVDGKDWMLTSSLYAGQGYATPSYEIFSLGQNGEKNILDKKSVEFEMEQGDLSDDYKEFQTSLNQYIEDGILIIACDIDLEEQLFVRTKETPWVPENYYDNALKKFDVTVLYEQPEPDKVCIRVQPSEVREQLNYFYIPKEDPTHKTADDQEWLLRRVENLDFNGKEFKEHWEGQKELGWQIVYNDIRLTGFEGGHLYYTYNDDSGIKECLIEDPKLCDYINVMLEEELNYDSYDVTKIQDIVSAKLEVASHFTDYEFYSQTITDEVILDQFEEWFRNAKYMYGGAECGNELACLELTLRSGKVVKLSMATDSCPNFAIDGVYYDYRPTQDWDNSEFYKYFNEIPYNP